VAPGRRRQERKAHRMRRAVGCARHYADRDLGCAMNEQQPDEPIQHCIFCRGIHELEPILGFATAKACRECNERFEMQINTNVLAVWREYRRKQ
jgi:hypothetical protein